MNYKKLLLTTISLSALLVNVRAQNRIYVNEYLNIGVGARGLAMGGAHTASTSDVTAAYWNPAGLMSIENDLQAGLMHAEYFSGISKYDYAGIAKPLANKNRVLGLAAMRFAVDDIPNTIDYVQADGSFDESKLKSMTAGDYAFLLSYAQKLKLFKNEAITTSVGANAKIIYRHLGKMANAWGAGLDIGLMARYKKLGIGLMFKDITTTYTSWSFHLSEKDKQVFGATGNEIPVKSYEVMYPRLNLGINYSFLDPGQKIQLLAELNADITTDGRRSTLINSSVISLDPRLGLEASYKKTIFLRAGICNFQKVLDDKDTTNQATYTLFQPSLGAGFNLQVFTVDYAFTSLQVQSNPLFTHVISLRIDLNNARKRLQQESKEAAPALKPENN